MRLSSTDRRSALHRQVCSWEIAEDNRTGLQELGGARWWRIHFRFDILPAAVTFCVNNVALPGNLPVLVIRGKGRAALGYRDLQDEISGCGQGQQCIVSQIEAVLYGSVPRDDRDTFF